MKTKKFRFVVIVFIVASLVAIIPFNRVGAHEAPILFPEGDIGSIPNLVLERRGDRADVYFPDVSAADDAFPIVAVLQGAGVDKGFYSGFGTQLARFGFVVVIPNHFQFIPSLPFPVLFPDQDMILDVLAQMVEEDDDASSPLSGIVDTTRMGLTGHSAGGAAGLFAINGSCFPPFCTPPPFFFVLPEAVKVGAFYGTNTCGLGGELTDPRCIDFAGVPPNPTGMIFGIDNNNIPVALVQGSNDGIGTPSEADATIAVLEGPNELIPIGGANHYGITDVNNPPGAIPDFSPQVIPQEVSITQIARASGEFILEALTEGELIPGEFPISAKKKLEVDNEVTMNGRRVTKGKTEANSVVEIDASRDTVSQVLPGLVPSVFPENNSDVKIKVEYDRSFVSDTTVFFKEIEIKKERTASFSGGGPFHIDKLKVKKGAVLNLGAGAYFVNELEMNEEDARLNLTSTPVVLHIGKKFKVEKKRIVLNAGGSVDGFRVYLHEDAELKAKEMVLTGLLYGPENKKVEVEKATVTGAIIISGEVKVKKQTDITYTETDQALVGLTISIPE